ncbi:hypothetical protein F443_21924 [Phytophthora nicotianae P1569]|uniref:Uncharacterized protein n=1 Tax=Phytophthora nicotianae P1569 TaxID=1317065 RepID=V9DYF3_PHYNI|nr:hypothetical protein F443_21924 [Phytophthora nicotianae P1569]
MHFSSVDMLAAVSRSSGERDEVSATSVETGREDTRYLADDVDPLRPLLSAVLVDVLSADAALKNSASFGILVLPAAARLLSVDRPHNMHRPSFARRLDSGTKGHPL